MPQRRGWVVITFGNRPLGDVAKDLAATGFAVGHVLNDIGQITGSASEDIVEKLRAIPGVADVSPDSSIDIGPPDASETW